MHILCFSTYLNYKKKLRKYFKDELLKQGVVFNYNKFIYG